MALAQVSTQNDETLLRRFRVGWRKYNNASQIHLKPGHDEPRQANYEDLDTMREAHVNSRQYSKPTPLEIRLDELDWVTQAAITKLEALETGQSHIFVSGPGQTTTATRLETGELECRTNPTPERPGLNMDTLFGDIPQNG